MQSYSSVKNFPALLREGYLGSIWTKNRIVMAPMASNLASHQGEVTPEMIEYYAARAVGGVGTIILETTCVDYPQGTNGTIQLRIDHDMFLPRLSEMTDRIKSHGAAVIVQISHAGGNTTPDITGTTPLAPSVVPYKHANNLPREVARDEIPRLVDCFVKAALRAKRAGFDGVEIHGAHGYLMAQFISPIMNQRTDDYGGTTENRARFAREVVRGIREAVGKDFGLLFRLSGDEFREGGRKIEETISIVKMLEQDGIDAIHVSAGTNQFNISASRTRVIEPPSFKEGWKVYLASAIKKEVRIPVITVGVIRSPQKAQEILQTGQADFVALGRALLADPDWVHKAASGEDGLICKCLSCGEGCSTNRTFLGRQIRCAVNPLAGRELQIAFRQKTHSAPNTKTVAVIGGGPAGMEAAIRAKVLGHKVDLYESSAELGGQLLLAAKPPDKEKIQWLITYLKNQVAQLNINVNLNHRITIENASVLINYDSVIVATGSVETNPATYGLAGAVGSDDFLSQPEKYLNSSIKKVVVSGGGMVACETAYLLAKQGLAVELVTQRKADKLASDLEAISRFELLSHLHEYQVGIKEEVNQREFVGTQRLRIKMPSSIEEVVADLFIASTPRVPTKDRLHGLIQQYCPQIYYAGDCVKVGKIMEAIHDGYFAALQLS